MTTQVQLARVPTRRALTVFSPPGVSVDTARYPFLTAGVLASTEPSEYLSIHDHPESWKGLDRETVAAMRRGLYRFVMPINGRDMDPSDAVETLQTIALSVSPVAMEVQVESLPGRQLQSQPGQLPTGPNVMVESIELLSQPEVSKVAEKITRKDIPASEGVCQLLEYDYTLDQVARIMAVGLLGRLHSRRFVPMRGAYKAVIDAFINYTLMQLVEKSESGLHQIWVGNLYGDSFTVLSIPGEPRVDYLRSEAYAGVRSVGYSLEDPRHATTDPKTSIFADYARFAVYAHLARQKETSHVIVLHESRSAANQALGPWIVRAGVQDALDSTPVTLDNKLDVGLVANSILGPDMKAALCESPLLSKVGLSIEQSATFPTARV